MRIRVLKTSLCLAFFSALLLWASTAYVWPIVQLVSFFALIAGVLAAFGVLAMLLSDWYQRTRDASTIYGRPDRQEK